ncbi:MAG: arylsulfatase, partial [Phycisphaerales bacterium]|nr:arylsulfatase [Phycisphaerales bacterium]
LTDDQGWGDIHSHGNEVIVTPVLDRLASEGARFERFYVSPVCAPTRAAFLTGRYYLRTGVNGVTHREEVMRSEERTLAEVLKDAGYATGCFGKWHNGAQYPNHPNGQGFDEFFGFCAGHWNNYFDTTLERNGNPVESKGYINDVVTDAALDFIDAHADAPFFCYVPYNTPHSPFQVPDRYFDPFKEQGLDDTLACVYGMVKSIDDNVGRLLDRLESHGLAGDTIVVFFGDNGPNTERYNGGMLGRKGSVHEGGVRNALFIRWPGHIPAGTEVKPIAAAIDLLPTLAELANVPVNPARQLDGLSLAPLLTGQRVDWPDRMLFSHWKGRGAVRTQGERRVLPRGRPARFVGEEEDDGRRRRGRAKQLDASEPAALERLGCGAVRAGEQQQDHA